ncbi:uncharacterized protein EHS24_005931 [Apiotrichum porosum]|uniref:Uncharacterized protein n=1 Tax=Apiotrichum porosum TaxID=105984 RepID=A0A427XZZ9_9TREE|nr:uncharacterized protein EHS24_005931 [Apiotrichum porosum]RSH84411.1 hypothetical protein EHS24_005931 [Apiotrichum porosum]
MPYISTEALVGAALIVVLAFGYQYTSTPNTDGSQSASKKNKKNKKKKSKGGAADEPSSIPASEIESDAPQSTKKNKGKGKGKNVAAVAPVVQVVKAPSPSPSPTPTPEPVAAPSFADAAAGGQSKPSKPRTLAEKLVPKPRKTKVDDMLEPEDRAPHLARVMKIAPTAPPPSAFASNDRVEKFEDDYEDSDSDSGSATEDTPAPAPGAKRQDDGWNVVAAKKKPVSIGIGGSSAPVVHNTYDGQTKIQRKNQKKNEVKKAAKADAEADRLRRLAMHKRDLERERINEIYSQSKQKKVTKQFGKVVGGGSTASVSDSGKLVWD